MCLFHKPFTDGFEQSSTLAVARCSISFPFLHFLFTSNGILKKPCTRECYLHRDRDRLNILHNIFLTCQTQEIMDVRLFPTGR